jgi:hypothetical protein
MACEACLIISGDRLGMLAIPGIIRFAISSCAFNYSSLIPFNIWDYCLRVFGSIDARLGGIILSLILNL